jgi:hypothetical protein
MPCSQTRRTCSSSLHEPDTLSLLSSLELSMMMLRQKESGSGSQFSVREFVTINVHTSRPHTTDYAKNILPTCGPLRGERVAWLTTPHRTTAFLDPHVLSNLFQLLWL